MPFAKPQPADAGGQTLETRFARAPSRASAAGPHWPERAPRPSIGACRCPQDRPTARPSETAPCPRRTAAVCRPARSPETRTRPPRPRRTRPAGCCCRSRRSAHPAVEGEHGLDVRDDRALGRSDECRVLRRIVLRRLPSLDGPADRQVAVDEIVRACLVGDQVGPRAAPHQFRQNFGGVAEQAHRHRRPAGAQASRRARARRRGPWPVVADIVLRSRSAIRLWMALDRRAKTRPAIVAASGCAPPMPPSPAVTIHRSASCPPKCWRAGFGEGLVGALDDALAAYVDPGPGRHLAVHHETLAIEFVEVLPRRPLRRPGSSWRSARAARRRAS